MQYFLNTLYGKNVLKESTDRLKEFCSIIKIPLARTWMWNICMRLLIVWTHCRQLYRSAYKNAPWRQANSLPAELRQPEVEIGQFRRLLKTSLFGMFAQDCGA